MSNLHTDHLYFERDRSVRVLRMGCLRKPLTAGCFIEYTILETQTVCTCNRETTKDGMMMLFVVVLRLHDVPSYSKRALAGDGFVPTCPAILNSTILIFSLEDQSTCHNLYTYTPQDTLNMADAEAPDPSTAPSEPQSRHIVYCGGSYHPITPPSLPQLTPPSFYSLFTTPRGTLLSSPYPALTRHTSLQQEEVVLRIRRDGKEMSGLAEESTSRDVR
jgi:hypothetical protein